MSEIASFEAFHPRAVKLLRKQKNFIVIAEDEPYFAEAYSLIRKNEMSKGTWTEEDERIYQSAQQRGTIYLSRFFLFSLLAFWLFIHFFRRHFD